MSDVLPAMPIFVVVGLAAILDFIVGDPHVLPHPVNLIAKWIKFAEKGLRGAGLGGKRLRRRGVWLCLSTIALSSLCVSAILVCLSFAGFPAGAAGCVYFLYAGLAARCLASEGKKVLKPLKGGDLKAARAQVGMLVGRDTDSLDEGGVIRAAVETVAENTADGVVSPLFWAALGVLAGYYAWGRGPLPALITGCAALWAFKAASTLDSVVGYKNERFIDIGRASAKADDLLNFIPARMTGLLMVLASGIRLRRAGECMRIMARDHGRHASPNSGWAEAAVSGALGIELGGGAFYMGSWVEKPFIGEKTRPPAKEDIRKAIDIMWISMALMLLLVFAAFAAAIR